MNDLQYILTKSPRKGITQHDVLCPNAEIMKLYQRNPCKLDMILTNPSTENCNIDNMKLTESKVQQSTANTWLVISLYSKHVKCEKDKEIISIGTNNVLQFAENCAVNMDT